MITRRDFLRRGCLGMGASTLGIPLTPLWAKIEIAEYRRGGMLYRRLGKSDLFLSVLGFGSHVNPQYSERAGPGSRLNEEGQKQRDRHIDRAIDWGINLLDIYDDCGQWIPMAGRVKGKRDRVLISVRLNERPGPLSGFIDRGAQLFGHLDLCRFVVVGEEPNLTPRVLEDWDLLRKGKVAGKIRVIGIATHSPEVMMGCLRELEGLDFILFPYNFIHARVSYGEFLPAAMKQGIGLMAMKPLAAGSIVGLDSRRPRPGARLQNANLSLYTRQNTPLLEPAVKQLTRELERTEDETLAQAALRFVFSQRFIASALIGMWLDEELQENHTALRHYLENKPLSLGALEAAHQLLALSGAVWLPKPYQWLDREWKA